MQQQDIFKKQLIWLNKQANAVNSTSTRKYSKASTAPLDSQLFGSSLEWEINPCKNMEIMEDRRKIYIIIIERIYKSNFKLIDIY